MNKTLPYLVLLLTLVPMSAIQAKRMAPTPVAPVVYDGVAYSAPTSAMGFVEARDEKTNQVVWVTKVYSVTYNPHLEADVQDVFITKLEFSDGNLLVTNENSEKYQVDPKTGKVISSTETNATRSGWLIAAVVSVLAASFAIYRYLLK